MMSPVPHSHRDVLENIIIGVFIDAFGFERGRRYGVKCEPIGVELLQQTPLDSTLGDVLIANSRIVRLIEFKREENKDSKEYSKFMLLSRALNGPALSHLIPLSRKVHWYVLTNFNRPQSSIVVPYLDFLNPNGDRDLAKFVQELTDDIAGPEMDEQESRDLRQYIQAVAQWAGSSRPPATTGGLLFVVNRLGQPQFLFIRDVRELAMTPRLVVEQRNVQERRIEMEREDRLRWERGMEIEGEDRLRRELKREHTLKL
jgi:hypothetical protein